MGERFYLRTMSAIGPMYFRGGYRFDSDPSTFHSDWSTHPPFAHDFASREEAFEFRNDNLPRSAVRVVRVGPPRRYTLTEKGRAATEPARQRVDGTSDGSKAVPSPSARPEGNGGPPDPGGFQAGDTWELFGGGERFAIAAGPSAGRVSVRRVSALGLGREEGPWLAHDTGGLRLVSRAGKPWPPVAEPAPAPKPEPVPVSGPWCTDSPVHEHAWQWRDGGLVCAHCGGRRVEAKA